MVDVLDEDWFIRFCLTIWSRDFVNFLSDFVSSLDVERVVKVGAACSREWISFVFACIWGRRDTSVVTEGINFMWTDQRNGRTVLRVLAMVSVPLGVVDSKSLETFRNLRNTSTADGGSNCRMEAAKNGEIGSALVKYEFLLPSAASSRSISFFNTLMVDYVGHVISVIVSREVELKTRGYDVALWPSKLK